jgi:hypothetical protein
MHYKKEKNGLRMVIAKNLMSQVPNFEKIWMRQKGMGGPALRLLAHLKT